MSKDKKKKDMQNAGYVNPIQNSAVCYPNTIADGEMEYTTFKPIGFDHAIQTQMTKLLHNLVMKYSDKTMSEKGFMQQIAVLFEDGAIKLRMYFHPELATYEERTANGQVSRKPIPQLGIMNGYFFVLSGNKIDLTQVTGIEKIMMPKAKIKYNERGMLAVKIKDQDASSMKLQDVFYVECNLRLTIAAILNLKLTDPNYMVKVTTISQSNQKRAILVDGRNNSYQVWIHVAYSSDESISRGYDPEDAIPYLTALASKVVDSKQSQKKLMREAEDKSEKKKSSDMKKLSKYL